MKYRRVLARPKVILFLIVIFGIILRLYFFIGMSVNDDIFYAYFANKIATGTYSPESFYSVRTGVLVPVSIFYRIFGVNEASSSSYFILISIGEIILAYYLGKFLFNQKVGLIGAFLVSIFAMDIIYATQLGPDIPLSFFTSLSFFFFLKGLKEKSNKYFISSGIFAGISYLIKSIGALILIVEAFYVLYLIISKKKFKLQYLCVLLGFLLIFGIEALTYYILVKDPLYHYNIDKKSFLLPSFLENGRNSDLHLLPYSMFNIWPSTDLGIFGYFYWLLIPAAIFGIFKKEKKIVILIYWFLFLFLYLEFGSMSLSNYVLMDRLPRYLIIITIPGMLIVAYFLSYFLGHSKRKFFQFVKTISFLVIIGILFITSMQYVKSSVKFFNEFMDEVRYAYKYLKTLPEKDIYACSWVQFKLEYYYGFKENGRLKVLNELDSIKNIKDSYVVMNGTRECIDYYEEVNGIKKCIFTEGWGPKDICDIPDNWRLLKTIEVPNSESIYKPKIYYAE